MPHSTSPVIGVSSWALHHELTDKSASGETRLSLLELPSELARRGFDAMHICHFHLPSHDEAYLAELRSEIGRAGLSLHAFLVDDGDITDPQNEAHDEAWIADLVPVAAKLGAQNVRIIAGKTNREGAIQHSARALKSFAAQASEQGVGLLIENWFDLLATPAAVHELLERCEGKARLLLDYGNWGGASKYEDLAAIAPLASSCHAKADFVGAMLDEVDYRRCLNLPYPAAFDGPYILVNGGLEGIEVLRDFIRGYPALQPTPIHT